MSNDGAFFILFLVSGVVLVALFAVNRLFENNKKKRNNGASRVAETRSTSSDPVKPETPVFEAKKEPQSTPKWPEKEIFISYRRDDSADITGRLFDSLIASFGKERVYKDVDSTRLGFDFAEQIVSHLETCRVALVVMGPNWAGEIDGSTRRIDNEDDFVRMEVRHLLSRGVPIIPVFVRGSVMPNKLSLPEDIRKLANRNGIKLRPDPDFHNDARRLATAIAELVDG